jgi:hypothetical protein
MRILRLWGWGVLAIWLAGTAQAWRPSGWVYHNYPWAYDSGSGDWHWLNTADTQWIANCLLLNPGCRRFMRSVSFAILNRQRPKQQG